MLCVLTALSCPPTVHAQAPRGAAIAVCIPLLDSSSICNCSVKACSLLCFTTDKGQRTLKTRAECGGLLE